jgi:hypothetical protein
LELPQQLQILRRERRGLPSGFQHFVQTFRPFHPLTAAFCRLFRTFARRGLRFKPPKALSQWSFHRKFQYKNRQKRFL